MSEATFHARFLEQALQLAMSNIEQLNGGPFGALIVRGDEVIADGMNLVTSSNDPTAHAEIVAIRAACRKLHSFELRGCVLYASCEPCPMCLATAYWSRVDAIFYAATKEDAARAGFDDSFIYSEITRPPAARAIPARNHLRAQGQQPLQLSDDVTEQSTLLNTPFHLTEFLHDPNITLCANA